MSSCLENSGVYTTIWIQFKMSKAEKSAFFLLEKVLLYFSQIDVII